MTALPRWSTDPRDSSCATRVVVPAWPTGVARDHALLAAHVRVLATLTGESEVVLQAPGAEAAEEAALSVSLPDGSWRDLLHAVRGTPALPVREAEGGLVLEHRLDHLDEEAARRVAGYHAAALAAMAADLDADHGAAGLVSEEERVHQLTALGGPVRDLPERRAHELFADRAAQHPDRVAATCADRSLTYGELDDLSNRAAHGLLAGGLAAEDVVAVVTERHLDWMVAVLGVLKAGGTYLPIEPHFPAARIQASLRRADCRVVVTEPGSRVTLDAALADLRATGPQVVEVAALVADQPTSAPAVPVSADQRAYIYFTSGSTGEPKGAMCEHAGMVNHLLAKLEDLGLAGREEQAVVAQTAPQCFDISLWQLVAALLVGGRTVIVPQPVILDPDRMLETIRSERVDTWQVVPSYLEVVLTQLDRAPAASLPDLRAVSVTGEAVKPELVRRFFDAPAMAGKVLVNAYGLTETSDDTNHEVMTTAPAEDRVPLGPAVRNVVIYVVDPDSGAALEPVPLGAPGEIVFSGVCVGRGYVNDPERTAAAFGQDPHRPGERVYRSGDFGRWRPDGSLEFLGRRDAQLKIAGFRIEIGDVENALLGAPGVRDAAVVAVAPPSGGTTEGPRHLVGFYSAADALDPEAVTAHLGDTLPPYMVPGVLHHRRTLPLSDNGKVDRKALAALALELSASEAGAKGPETDAERRIATVWAAVLGVPVADIGRLDHFVERGGSSLSAVKVVVALDRALTLKQVVTTPVLADLADLLDLSASLTSGASR